MTATAQSEVGTIQRLLLKDPAAAFIDQAHIDKQWRALNYLAPPDFGTAVSEYNQFLDLLSQQGIEFHFLPSDPNTGMDSLYVRDASIVTDQGVILCNMGKLAREGEPHACARFYETASVMVAGVIESPGKLEAGDVAWLDPRTLVVGHGYRTNSDGIAQLAALLSHDVELVTVPLPHWQGPDDVFHLMSMLSPINENTLLVYPPLLPVPFIQLLISRDFRLIAVPDEEFGSMGCNVLSIGEDRCLMLEGNPVTKKRLEAAGVEVLTYRGLEISQKGCGGPTCLTRPLLRQLP